MLIAANGKFADKISGFLEEYSNVEIDVIIPESVARLIERVQSAVPDMVVIDSELPDFDWATAVYDIKNLKVATCVILLADNPDKAKLLSAFREGADAYISRKLVRDEVIFALKAVSEGYAIYKQEDTEAIRHHMIYLELGSARKVTDVKNGVAKLTVRQKEVFPLLADGKSIKEIGEILGISPKTVETHKYEIMKKLHLERMADMTKLAIIKDLIPL